MSSSRIFKKVELNVIIDATNGWIEDVKIVVLRNIFKRHFLAIRTLQELEQDVETYKTIVTSH